VTTVASNLEVTFPPNPCPSKPRFVPPPGSWDTHFLVYGPPNLFPYSETRRYTPPAAPVEHWLKIADAIGIDRGVMVQPSVHGTKTDITLNAVAKSDGRLRGMIRANSKLTDAEIRELHKGGVRGMRMPFAKKVRGTFDEAELRRNVSRLEAVNWVLCFQLDGTMIEEHADVIGSMPVQTCIDGFGGIHAGKGLDQPHFRTLLDLMGRDHMWLKLQGFDRHIRTGTKYEDIVAMARAIIAKAPDRVIWGTDWPHSEIFEPGLAPDDGKLLDMMLDFAPDEATRNRILADNPSRLFDFD
jgi:predicted TIM-barrel fold metal-dependent hydrolase